MFARHPGKLIFTFAFLGIITTYKYSQFVQSHSLQLQRTDKIYNMSESKPTVTELLSKSKNEILTFLGGIYEHSSWVAEEFYDSSIAGKSSPSEISNVRDLFHAMSLVVTNSSYHQKLSLLKSHPDLCEKIEKLKGLTKESQEEQSNAGLHTLTDAERDRFNKLNSEYREKFGFPFILAVRNATKHTVLSAIDGRIHLSKDAEFEASLHQVHKIAWMRILNAFQISNQKGFLTCHVLDTANGCPASKMRVQLHRLSPPDKAGFLKEFILNDDGRIPGGPALKEEEFIVGNYEWTFFVDEYFARRNTKTCGTPFLNEVPLRFGIDDPEEHYHVPLLVSPYGYSTYRGS